MTYTVTINTINNATTLDALHRAIFRAVKERGLPKSYAYSSYREVLADVITKTRGQRSLPEFIDGFGDLIATAVLREELIQRENVKELARGAFGQALAAQREELERKNIHL